MGRTGKHSCVGLLVGCRAPPEFSRHQKLAVPSAVSMTTSSDKVKHYDRRHDRGDPSGSDGDCQLRLQPANNLLPIERSEKPSVRTSFIQRHKWTPRHVRVSDNLTRGLHTMRHPHSFLVPSPSHALRAHSRIFVTNWTEVETLRNIIVLRDAGSTLGLGTDRTASWETQETLDTCTSFATSSRKPRQTTKQAVQVTVLLRCHHQHKLRVEFRSTGLCSSSDPFQKSTA